MLKKQHDINPSNSQNYNRFSYVLNNPLKYVDPSGYNYQYYIDGLPVSARMARKFMWDDVDLNFHSTRSGNMGANIDNFHPQRVSANVDAINRAFNLFENLTGVALSYKNGNVGYWTSFSYNSLFKSSEIAGEGWSGVWPSNMTNHGLKFNSFFDVINDQLKAKQSFDEFNQKMSFWAEHNSNSNSGNPAKTASDVNNYSGIFISAADQVIKNTKFGSNIAYAISGNSNLVSAVNNGLKFAPYAGLGVTMLTGYYLSMTKNPATNQPYQSWFETGTDIGANLGIIYIGTQFGGWWGAGAAAVYLLDKAAFKAYIEECKKGSYEGIPKYRR